MRESHCARSTRYQSIAENPASRLPRLYVLCYSTFRCAKAADTSKVFEHDALSGVTSGQSSTALSPGSGRHGRHHLQKSDEVPDPALADQQRLGSVGKIVASNASLTGPVEASTGAQPLTLDPITEQPVFFPEKGEENALLDNIWNDTNYDPAWFNIEPELYYGNNNNSCGFIPNAHIVDEVDRQDMMQLTEPTAATPLSGITSATFRYFRVSTCLGYC